MTMTDTAVEREIAIEHADVPVVTRGVPVRAMAFGLWGVVGGLLAYGVLQTALKAAALFG